MHTFSISHRPWHHLWLYSSSSLGVHFRAMVDLHGRCTISSLITMQSRITVSVHIYTTGQVKNIIFSLAVRDQNVFTMYIFYSILQYSECTMFYSILYVHGVTILSLQDTVKHRKHHGTLQSGMADPHRKRSQEDLGQGSKMHNVIISLSVSKVPILVHPYALVGNNEASFMALVCLEQQ